MKKPEQTSEMSIYEIRIRGKLDERWSDWFNGMTISIEQVDNGIHETMLKICIPDQAKLRGILNKIWDLNLTVICVNCIDSNIPSKEASHD